MKMRGKSERVEPGRNGVVNIEDIVEVLEIEFDTLFGWWYVVCG